jgi:hypothetical protein
MSCASSREVTLTPFPETGVDYTYHILLPNGTTGAVVFWYYGVERRENLIYTSGYVPIRTGILRTEAHFSKAGTHILVVMSQTPSGIQKIRYRYAVRQNFVSLR